MTITWLRALMCSVLAAGAAGPVVAHAQTRAEETASTATNYPGTASIYPGTASITYVGKWHTTEITRNWSGGTAALSIWGNSSAPEPQCRSGTNVPAAKVKLSFNGTGVRWIGARGPELGMAEVFLDGVSQGIVDAYLDVIPAGQPGADQIQAELFGVSGLADGPHTLEIEVLGDKNRASTSCVVVVDAFDIEGTPSGRIQESGPAAVTYFGTWIQGDDSRPYSGGTAAYSDAELDPGIVPTKDDPRYFQSVGIAGLGYGWNEGVTTRAVFTFSGTRVAWIGSTGPRMGKANVYVDGQLVQAGVDTYALTEQTRVPLFTSAVLRAGIHSLAIEVRGDKNPLSGGVSIVVDAFDVTPCRTGAVGC